MNYIFDYKTELYTSMPIIVFQICFYHDLKINTVVKIA